MNFGIHVGGDIAASINMYAASAAPGALVAAQLFTHGPRNRRANAHDVVVIRATAALHGVALYVHSSYLTNPWPRRAAAGVDPHIIEQFAASARLGARGVVIHIPKIAPAAVAAGTARLCAALVAAGLGGQTVILEMKAVRADPLCSYESPAKINRLIATLAAAGLGPPGPDAGGVGICIDTAHIYAGGADVRTRAAAEQYLDAIEKHEWITLIHLNGNAYDAKKRAGDKHEPPGGAADMIWGAMPRGESFGAHVFVEYAARRGIHFILELKDEHRAEFLTFITSPPRGGV